MPVYMASSALFGDTAVEISLEITSQLVNAALLSRIYGGDVCNMD